MQDSLFSNEVTSKVDLIVAELHKVDGWPADSERDRQYVGLLVEQFPALDLAEEIRAWRRWLVVKGTGKEVKSRGRFTRLGNWCRRAVPGAAAGGARRAERRTGTFARPAEEFGDTRVVW